MTDLRSELRGILGEAFSERKMKAILALASRDMGTAAGVPLECEPMRPDAEGWSEWIHPLPGYLMQCCDCGLVHEMEFAVGERAGQSGALNEGESEDSVILFRARRHEPSSAEQVERDSPGDAKDLLLALLSQIKNSDYKDKYGHPIEHNTAYMEALASFTGETK